MRRPRNAATTAACENFLLGKSMVCWADKPQTVKSHLVVALLRQLGLWKETEEKSWQSG